MARFTAFLDASALYPAPLRDLLLDLAVADLYRAKWSNAVHDEWINALLRTRDDLTRDRLERTRDLMNTHVRDALVGDFEDLIDVLKLPDPDEFLTHQFHLSQPVFLKSIKTVRLRLKNPPKSIEEYLDTLRAQGLLATVSEIAAFDQFI